MACVAVTGRFDPADAQWAIPRPLLPVARRPGRPSKWTKRQFIDGIRWRVRTGAPWRDMLEWQAVQGLVRHWQRDGTWAPIQAALQTRADAAGLITWDVSVDSTIMRAHQHAAGAVDAVTCNASHPAARSPSRPIMDWDAHTAGGRARRIWPASRGRCRCRRW